MAGHNNFGRLTPEEQDRENAQRDLFAMQRDRIARLETMLANANTEKERYRDRLEAEQREHINTSFQLTEELNRAKGEANDFELLAVSWAMKFESVRTAATRAVKSLQTGPGRVAVDALQQAIARCAESTPQLWPCEGDGQLIPVAGRGLRAGVVAITTSEGGLVIRVDDESNPEFWIEISISRTRLLRLLARVCQGEGEQLGPQPATVE